MSGFQDIVGHKQIIEHLKNAEKMNKVSHAYIFSGEKGSGKKLLANTFGSAGVRAKSLVENAVPVVRQKAETIRTSSGSPMKNRIPSV